jgi:hypothetical protein
MPGSYDYGSSYLQALSDLSSAIPSNCLELILDADGLSPIATLKKANRFFGLFSGTEIRKRLAHQSPTSFRSDDFQRLGLHSLKLKWETIYELKEHL